MGKPLPCYLEACVLGLLLFTALHIPRTVLNFAVRVYFALRYCIYLHVEVVHGEAQLYARRAVSPLQRHLHLRSFLCFPAIS